MQGLRALLAGVVIAAAAPAAAGIAPECSTDPNPAVVIASIFAGEPECDPNRDQASSAADLAKTAAVSMLPACVASGASLDIDVDNRSAEEPVAVTVIGELLDPSCRSAELVTFYDLDLECVAGSSEACGRVDGLLPGVWRHRFASGRGAGLQLQYRKTLISADTVADSIHFTRFASAITVTSAANAGDGTLRSALQAAPAAQKPLLIRFHDVRFPAGVPTVIPLDFQLTALSTDDVTIDGTDAMGDAGFRVVDAQGLPFGILSITGARNHIIGLRLRGAGGANRDIVQISGASAAGNIIEKCIITDSASGDGVSVDADAGTDFDATVNVIRSCEIRATGDKAVKVTTGAHARVERSWIHQNSNGGLQSTLGGNLAAVENLIESNVGGTAQNGMSVQGFDMTSPAATLSSTGDIIRRNGANGIAVRGHTLALIRDGYLAANGTSGLRVFNDVGAAATAMAEGTTFACNRVDGAVVADGSKLDLGGGALASSGNNALTQNNLPQGGANFRNAISDVVSAGNNQWEHCGTGATCDDVSIAAYDLSDNGLRTSFVPSQAHRAPNVPVITSVSAPKGRVGELLRIYGRHFNAIDGHFAEDACEDVAGRNRCVPLRGNCVRIGGVAATVEAVTPTMLVVRWPFTCAAPVQLTVTVDHGSAGASSAPLTVCTNAPAD